MSAILSDETVLGTHVSSRLAALLGRPNTENVEDELATKLPFRLELDLLDALKDEGLTPDELVIVIPKRTLTHRRQKGEKLSCEESDKALRVARLLMLAESDLVTAKKP